MLKQVIRQFHLTKTERCGAAALLLLSGICFLSPSIYRYFYRPEPTNFTAFLQRGNSGASTYPAPETAEKTSAQTALFPFDPNTASVEMLVQLGLSEKLARTIEKYRSRGGMFRSAEDLQKIYTLSAADYERLRPYVRLAGRTPATFNNQDNLQKTAATLPSAAFPFNPNTASEQDLLRLGLPAALVQRLLHYREKGGFFPEKTAFKKLYGLRESDYQRLEPFITIEHTEPPMRPSAYAGGAASRPTISTLDINTANTADWQQLPGIGAVRAQKIVWFREKLGGFVHPDQVGETRDLPDSIFQQIRPYLQVNTPVFRKINMNTATVAELAAHPYFDFKQGKLLVAYREQHGPFSSVRDLGRIAAFVDSAWRDKVQEYLSVE